MKRVRVAIGLLLSLAMVAQAEDFTLTGGQHLDITAIYENGFLYDFSTVNVLEAGRIQIADVYNEATLNFSGGSGGAIRTRDSSSVNLYGGSIDGLNTYETSIANLFDGRSESLDAYNSSVVNLFGGSFNDLYAFNSSKANISGGIASYIYTSENSTLNLSGGRVSYLAAGGTSTITINGHNFVLGSGLWLDGNHLMGTGTLGGRWFNGVSWTTEITGNGETATILLIPEPCTLLLLGLGGLLIKKR